MSGQNRFVADLFKDLLSVSSVKFLVTRALGFEGFFLLHSFINNPTYLFTSPFVNDRMPDFSFNGWNVAIWPFKWNLFSDTFGWCYLHLSILQKKKKIGNLALFWQLGHFKDRKGFMFKSCLVATQQRKKFFNIKLFCIGIIWMTSVQTRWTNIYKLQWRHEGNQYVTNSLRLQL